ncbi:hypothetical protein BN946_scf184901.g8 [Trametes cinnabarina]|uniref:Protein-S-isoprenylcysteine O-methyltransferase n=1 Tax=Pycnoporus cinnabarinus TaxID=5643 RepID=A0A060SRV3_PYCCI|nr:hypothetical protein BN946_scf184901.g8 [Trametes cinnabarina]
MASSLLVFKVPMLLAAMYAEFVALTPPNATPSKEDATRGYDGRDIITRLSLTISRFAIAVGWLTHGCEIAAILAQEVPGVADVVPAVFSPPFFWQDGPFVDELALDPMFLLGFALLAFGTAVRKTCYNTLGRHFTFQLAILKEHKLVTWGPYSVVRHPSYSGVIAAFAGMVAMQLSPGSWLTVGGALHTPLGQAIIGGWVGWLMLLVFGFTRRVLIEDAVLRKEFGSQWDEWARRVPNTLIPYLW